MHRIRTLLRRDKNSAEGSEGHFLGNDQVLLEGYSTPRKASSLCENISGEFTTVKDTIPADSTAPGKYAIFSEVAIPGSD